MEASLFFAGKRRSSGSFLFGNSAAGNASFFLRKFLNDREPS
jgi:hypothetical protein